MVEVCPPRGLLNAEYVVGSKETAIVTKINALVSGSVIPGIANDNVLVGMGGLSCTGVILLPRAALPPADLRKCRAAVSASKQIYASDDHIIWIDRIDPQSVVIITLIVRRRRRSKEVCAVVYQKKVHASVAASIKTSIVVVYGCINDRRVASSVSYLCTPRDCDWTGER